MNRANGSPADGSPTDRSPADRSPADASPANQSPTDRGPADASPADSSPDIVSPAQHPLPTWRRRLHILRRTLRATTLAVSLAWVPLYTVYLIDLVDACGMHADVFLVLTLLVVLFSHAWWTGEWLVHLLSRKLRTPLRLGLRTLALCALWSPLWILSRWPNLQEHSFLDRHEQELLTALRTKDTTRGTYYEHGAAFWFHWKLPSDSWFVLVYEPDRPAGAPPLSRDTDRFNPRLLQADRHLRGPWFAITY